MPNLKINSCEQCPHSVIKREEWMDDCYKIICEHEEQENTEGFTHKIKFGESIYFKCPLDKPIEYECSVCDWKGFDAYYDSCGILSCVSCGNEVK